VIPGTLAQATLLRPDGVVVGLSASLSQQVEQALMPSEVPEDHGSAAITRDETDAASFAKLLDGRISDWNIDTRKGLPKDVSQQPSAKLNSCCSLFDQEFRERPGRVPVSVSHPTDKSVSRRSAHRSKSTTRSSGIPGLRRKR
jgi:hypothetical protein